MLSNDVDMLFLKIRLPKKSLMSVEEKEMLIFIVCQESSWMLNFP